MNPILKSLLDALLSPTGIVTAIGVLGGIVGLLTGANAIRRRRVATAVFHAFHIVEDLDNEMNSEHLDKVVAGLKAADDWMKANGWRALRPGEQEVAKLEFTALNGQMHASAKVATEASLGALSESLTSNPQQP